MSRSLESSGASRRLIKIVLSGSKLAIEFPDDRVASNRATSAVADRP